MSTPEPARDVAGADEGLAPGSRVQVRTRFDGSWVGGFEVIDGGGGGFRIRRRSDGYEIPRRFDSDDVRPQPTP